MSAFMLSEDAFQRIANALPWDYGRVQGSRLCYALRRELIGMPELDASMVIIRDWYKANRLAVAGRYGDKAIAKIPETLPEGFRVTFRVGPKGVALFKLIQCLRYQCCEDVAKEHEEWHQRIVDEMETALDLIGHDLISQMPEYEAAPWG